MEEREFLIIDPLNNESVVPHLRLKRNGPKSMRVPYADITLSRQEAILLCSGAAAGGPTTFRVLVGFGQVYHLGCKECRGRRVLFFVPQDLLPRNLPVVLNPNTGRRRKQEELPRGVYAEP